MAKIKDINLLDNVEVMAKANIGPMNAEQQDRQGTSIPLGNSLRGLLQALRSKVAQSFPVTVEDISLGKLNNPEPSVKDHAALDDNISMENESNRK